MLAVLWLASLFMFFFSCLTRVCWFKNFVSCVCVSVLFGRVRARSVVRVLVAFLDPFFGESRRANLLEILFWNLLKILIVSCYNKLCFTKKESAKFCASSLALTWLANILDHISLCCCCCCYYCWLVCVFILGKKCKRKIVRRANQKNKFSTSANERARDSHHLILADYLFRSSSEQTPWSSSSSSSSSCSCALVSRLTVTTTTRGKRRFRSCLLCAVALQQSSRRFFVGKRR